MKIFAVKNSNNDLIAYHEDLDVVEKYVQNVKVSHPDTDLVIGKISDKFVRRKDPNHELYLERYSETYVQSGYLIYLEVNSSQHIYDMKYCKEIIIRTIDQWKDDMDEKDIKYLKKAAKVFDELLFDAESFTPTLSELRSIRDVMEPYIKYNRGVYFD